MVAVTQAEIMRKRMSQESKTIDEEEKDDEDCNRNRVKEAYGPEYVKKTLENAINERARRKTILRLKFKSNSVSSLPSTKDAS